MGSNLLLVVVLSMVCGLGSTIFVSDCPSHLVTRRPGLVKVFRDKCYLFEIYRHETFSQAESFCNETGGTLAKVTSEEVNDFLFHNLKLTFDVRGAKVWIGLRYNSYDGDYFWMDGERNDYSNFESRVKAFRTTDMCVAMDSTGGVWDNFNCENIPWQPAGAKKFICEYQPVPQTTATTEDPQSLAGMVTSTSTLQARSVDDCPRNLKRDKYLKVYGDKCYQFSEGAKTFKDTKTYCKNLGGYLAMPKTPGMNRFIWDEMVDTFYRYNIGVWIGMEYKPEVGYWQWDDGTNVTYSHFQLKEHEKQTRGCPSLFTHDGFWIPIACDLQPELVTFYVCEFPLSISTSVGTSVSTVTPTTATPTTTTTTAKITQPSSTPPTTTTTTTTPTTTITTTTPTTSTTTPPTTTTTPPTTTTTPRTTTTTPPTTTTTPPPTTTTTTTTKAVCPDITCELNCGLDGYRVDPVTNCLLCECEGE